MVEKFTTLLSFLRELYGKYPRSFSFVELTVYSGIFVSYMWIVPFWFWGIYRLNIAVPKTLEILFYGLWLEKDLARVMVSILGLCFFLLSSLIRQDSLRELGIRFDNLRESGRECFLTSMVLALMIVVCFIFWVDKYSPHRFILYLKEVFQGIIQQFLLQSVVLLRFLRIFGKKSISVVSAAALFSLAHSPNIPLILLTLSFGCICCVLFLRNRNIFALGMMHGLLAVFFSSFLVPGLVHDFKVGPWTGDPRWFAHIDYDGTGINANPSERIVIPIFVTNKGRRMWDSKDEKHPVSISYHLLGAKGEMMKYDNIRTPFNKTMRPEESARVDLMVDAPPEKGEYYLEVDLVKEKVTWFKDIGTRTKWILLSVN